MCVNPVITLPVPALKARLQQKSVHVVGTDAAPPLLEFGQTIVERQTNDTKCSIGRQDTRGGGQACHDWAAREGALHNRMFTAYL